MNELLLLALLTTITGALPLIFVGYQIAVNNKNHWINGVDQSTLSNPEGFAKFVGHSITITGVLISVVSLLLYMQVINYIGFAIALTMVSILPLPCFFKAKKKYA
ncbi:hypothetical protein [Paraglaciecola sp. L3A3]|uniref:hypothetical protein n=1 Tax=Paraglaciecola sp. L3A3 TaxID=2686358 RepID=UPI00131CFD5B|nr:hypothetical protein [Paraglaciecola sp. L3A3]